MTDSQQKPVIAVLGPTACGKSGLALEIAKHFDCEIINCDSRQIYDEMRIGTAHPTEDEMQQVAHHLFSIIKPSQTFSADAYAKAASEQIKQVWQRRRLPLLVGGTGFYYDALSSGLGAAGSNEELAQQLQQELEIEGLAAMQARLHQLDSAAIEQIDKNNPRRLLRALEIVISSGQPLSANHKKLPLPMASFLPLVVTRPRLQLHQAIESRVDSMLAMGLRDEVLRLAERYEFVAPGLNSIGYKEWQAEFIGAANLEQTREAIIIHTRQYARRQEIWLRRRPGPPCFDLSLPEQKATIFNNITAFIKAFEL